MLCQACFEELPPLTYFFNLVRHVTCFRIRLLRSSPNGFPAPVVAAFVDSAPRNRAYLCLRHSLLHIICVRRYRSFRHVSILARRYRTRQRSTRHSVHSCARFRFSYVLSCASAFPRSASSPSTTTLFYYHVVSELGVSVTKRKEDSRHPSDMFSTKLYGTIGQWYAVVRLSFSRQFFFVWWNKDFLEKISPQYFWFVSASAEYDRSLLKLRYLNLLFCYFD